MNVTKKDLIDSLKKNSDLDNAKADEFVNLFFNKIKSELQKNQLVKISGFGTFEVIHTKQRIGRNPKTLEEYVIPRFKSTIYVITKIKKDYQLIFKFLINLACTIN